MAGIRIVVLGGCGIMGASVARDLIKTEDVKRVTLADYKIRMTNVHETVQKSSKISTQQIDVTDFPALVQLIKGNDVVVNCVGPYYRFGIHTMKAAVEAGVHYLDIMDDYDTTLAAFEKMDKPAKKAGLSICIGFGSDPGTTNVIVRYACDKLDEVDYVGILWAYGLNDPMGPGGWRHTFHALHGNVPQYLDGKLEWVPAGSGVEEVDFPEPWGRCPVSYYGHPEPITIPRFIKGVKTVVNKGCSLPLWGDQLIKDIINHGLSGDEPIMVNGVSIKPRDVIAQIMIEAPAFRKQVEEYRTGPLDIVVRGRKGGNAITYRYRLSGVMAPGTGIPASICAQMLARGEIEERGVLAPEGFANYNTFFSRFTKRGFRLTEEKTVTSEVQF